MQPAVYKYTFWSYAEKKRERDEGWRLDYFLASKSILNSVVSSNMFSDIGGSDHCPIFPPVYTVIISKRGAFRLGWGGLI